MELKKQQKEKEKIPKCNGLLLDVLFQACGTDKMEIDNMALSSYEDACKYLSERGYINYRNDRIYKVGARILIDEEAR